MSPLMANLEEYGVNIPETMERFLNNEGFYIKCLKMLVADPQFDELGTVLRIPDYDQAFRLTHALKGVVGNMGLAPLHLAIHEMVESLRRQEYGRIDPQYREIMNQYEKVRALLADA